MRLDAPEQLSATGAPGAVALYDTTLRNGTHRGSLPQGPFLPPAGFPLGAFFRSPSFVFATAAASLFG